MELINVTRMQTAFTMGLEASGRELLVVVIKGTFVLPKPGEQVRLHDLQMPLMTSDTFTGDPGFSAPMLESDFAPRKPRCDVLLLGSAYAPAQRPTTRTQVGIRMGGLRKVFDVVGDRAWQAGATGIRAGDPRPFVRQPISYDVAFGGTDLESDDPAEHDAYAANPVGRGFHKNLKSACVDGRPLPNTEATGKPVTWPKDSYEPMAFGPVGRGWTQRARWAGTYDEQWLAETFPFLPADFDERYFQAAPDDQQIAKPTAPAEVELLNLTPDGLRRFSLPHFEAPVSVFPRNGEREDLYGALDTVTFDPDEERFTMVWRVTRPLKKNLLEIEQVMVGRKGRAWWQQREELTFPIQVIMVPMGVDDAAPR